MPQKTSIAIISVSDMGNAYDKQHAVLVLIYGGDIGRRFNLDRAKTVIGRPSNADIQIDQYSVSRNHAEITNNGQAVTIHDLNSANGTYVNDELVRQRALRDGDFIKIGRTIFKFLCGADIEHAYHEEIYRLTTIDGLTQIYDKRFFDDTLEREFSRAIRYRQPMTLIMFGIDDFKATNNRYGHLAGDALLQQLATLIRGRLRREDTFARYAGSEFAILLPEVDIAKGRTIAEKVRMIVERGSFGFELTKIPVTISVGVAFAEPTDNVNSLIERAQQRLNEAREAGRNCCRG